MKRWAFLTVFLYALVISVLAVPLIALLGTGDQGDSYRAFYAFFLPVLVAIQAALLLIPVAVSRERPVKRRTAVASATAGAFLMAVLLASLAWFILNMILGESGYDGAWFEWALPAVTLGLWGFWGIVFYRKYAAGNPGAMTTAITGWLLKGSILEILIAVPAHILSRHRNECCMPGVTLAGLLTGISVALMAFGPGLFFLFADKVKEKTVARAP